MTNGKYRKGGQEFRSSGDQDFRSSGWTTTPNCEQKGSCDRRIDFYKHWRQRPPELLTYCPSFRRGPGGLHAPEIFARMRFLLFYVRNHRVHRTSRSHADSNGWVKAP